MRATSFTVKFDVREEGGAALRKAPVFAKPSNLPVIRLFAAAYSRFNDKSK